MRNPKKLCSDLLFENLCTVKGEVRRKIGMECTWGVIRDLEDRIDIQLVNFMFWHSSVRDQMEGQP